MAWGGSGGRGPASSQDQLSCLAFRFILGPRLGLKCPPRTPAEKVQCEAGLRRKKNAPSRPPPGFHHPLLRPGRNCILSERETEVHSGLVGGLLPSLFQLSNHETTVGTGGLKILSEILPLANSSSSKMAEGVSRRCKRCLLEEGHYNLTHQGPREVSASFAKQREPGAGSPGKGWWLVAGLNPAGPVPPPCLPAWSSSRLSALVMEILGGISSGSVVGRGGRGTPVSKGSGSVQPRPGPVERRRRGRRRSAPSMLAWLGSGVSLGL